MIIQLLWGEEKIEFDSEVIENDEKAIYVTPYYHNGSVLGLEIVQGKGVVCNLFLTDPATKQRLSWKGVTLSTVERNGETLYAITTNSFNQLGKQDDRRLHERIVVQAKAKVFDGILEDGIDIMVHDISDVGVSFYAPANYEPITTQVTVTFSDTIDDKTYNNKVECTISRVTNKAGNKLVGCKVTNKNKDYQIYGFLKLLKSRA